MIRYERRLPHWDVIGAPLFVTFSLSGSFPPNRKFPPANVTSGEAFVAMDRLLDAARTGPRYLQNPEFAGLVADALHEGEHKFQRYELHSWVIMANHVHLLITPHVVATQWLGPLKGFTAHRSNRLLKRKGTPFWQEESYDHLVRTGEEFQRIQAYIENNPVRAGLVKDAALFPWSSASVGFQPPRPAFSRLDPLESGSAAWKGRRT